MEEYKRDVGCDRRTPSKVRKGFGRGNYRKTWLDANARHGTYNSSVNLTTGPLPSVGTVPGIRDAKRTSTIFYCAVVRLLGIPSSFAIPVTNHKYCDPPALRGCRSLITLITTDEKSIRSAPILNPRLCLTHRMKRAYDTSFQNRDPHLHRLQTPRLRFSAVWGPSLPSLSSRIVR